MPNVSCPLPNNFPSFSPYGTTALPPRSSPSMSDSSLDMSSLAGQTVGQLKATCKELKLKNYSKLGKGALLDLIRARLASSNASNASSDKILHSPSQSASAAASPTAIAAPALLAVKTSAPRTTATSSPARPSASLVKDAPEPSSNLLPVLQSQKRSAQPIPIPLPMSSASSRPKTDCSSLSAAQLGSQEETHLDTNKRNSPPISIQPSAKRIKLQPTPSRDATNLTAVARRTVDVFKVPAPPTSQISLARSHDSRTPAPTRAGTRFVPIAPLAPSSSLIQQKNDPKDEFCAPAGALNPREAYQSSFLPRLLDNLNLSTDADHVVLPDVWDNLRHLEQAEVALRFVVPVYSNNELPSCYFQIHDCESMACGQLRRRELATRMAGSSDYRRARGGSQADMERHRALVSISF